MTELERLRPVLRGVVLTRPGCAVVDVVGGTELAVEATAVAEDPTLREFVAYAAGIVGMALKRVTVKADEQRVYYVVG